MKYVIKAKTNVQLFSVGLTMKRDDEVIIDLEELTSELIRAQNIGLIKVSQSKAEENKHSVKKEKHTKVSFESKNSSDKEECPYCGKKFKDLSKHKCKEVPEEDDSENVSEEDDKIKE